MSVLTQAYDAAGYTLGQGYETFQEGIADSGAFIGRTITYLTGSEKAAAVTSVALAAVFEFVCWFYLSTPVAIGCFALYAMANVSPDAQRCMDRSLSFAAGTELAFSLARFVKLSMNRMPLGDAYIKVATCAALMLYFGVKASKAPAAA